MEANSLKKKAPTHSKMEQLSTAQLYKKNYNKQNREKINEYQRNRYAEKKKDKVVKIDDLSVMKETLIQQKELIEKLHEKLLTQENAIYHLKKGVSVVEKNIERVGYSIAPKEAHEAEEANTETSEIFKQEESADFLIDAWGNIVDV